MSIENALAALTAAVEANTAAIKAMGTAAPAAAAEKTTKPAKTGKSDGGYTPKHDKAQMQAALIEVKESKGVGEAKRIIKDIGKQDKMADIVSPEIVDAVYVECCKVLVGDEDM
jgi:hypothetical protein